MNAGCLKPTHPGVIGEEKCPGGGSSLGEESHKKRWAVAEKKMPCWCNRNKKKNAPVVDPVGGERPYKVMVSGREKKTLVSLRGKKMPLW